MNKTKFRLKGEPYIELNKLLKAMNLVETGGQAKGLILDGYVTVNQEVESRIRAKITPGMIVSIVDEIEIEVLE
jgi:ribosome-associated protein